MDLNYTFSAEYGDLPDEPRRLVWDIFFAARRRGVNLEFHFPWLRNRDGYTCVSMKCETNSRVETIATLVIKAHNMPGVGPVGLIGLVCVDARYRGRGLSIQLMRFAEQYATKAALQALVLWTTKPRVYEKVGFVTDSVDLFGVVRRAGMVACARADLGDVRETSQNGRGVPAFAEGVVEYSTADARVVVCNSPGGQSLVEWAGHPDMVAALISHVLPKEWRINTTRDCTLIVALRERGYELDLQASANRMVLGLGRADQTVLPYIGILDRI